MQTKPMPVSNIVLPVIQAIVASAIVILLSALVLMVVERAIAFFYKDSSREQKLISACWKLCDDINDQHPDKDPHSWRCPHMDRIAHLIGYRRRG